jgi:hypothetical protein
MHLDRPEGLVALAPRDAEPIADLDAGDQGPAVDLLDGPLGLGLQTVGLGGDLPGR